MDYRLDYYIFLEVLIKQILDKYYVISPSITFSCSEVTVAGVYVCTYIDTAYFGWRALSTGTKTLKRVLIQTHTNTKTYTLFIC